MIRTLLTMLAGSLLLSSGGRAAVPPDLAGVDSLAPSEDFQVWINGEEQFVFSSSKTGSHGSHNITRMSFLGFDLVRPAEVRVQPRVAVRDFAIRPYSTGIPGTLEGDTISFRLDRPGTVVVQVNGSYDPVLILSADPPEDPPKPSEVTRFFGPGVHDLGGHLPLASGDRVYLARGAIVKGAFSLNNVEDVSIRGRGIVYNGHVGHDEDFRVVRGDNTRDVLIEGITLCHSPGWIVSFWGGSTNLTVRNVKMLGNWWYNTDGVQTGTDGLRVEDCFLQCNDDNFSLNGVCRNVVIRSNLLWNLYNGGVFMLGWATGQQFDLENIDIRDNVILRAGGCCEYDRKGPISMKLFGSRRSARDIRFENLVVEDIAPYGRWINLQATPAKESTVRDLAFDNINVLHTWRVEGELAGPGSGPPIDSVSFSNVRLEGRLMSSPEDGGLTLKNTRNVQIEGVRFEDVEVSAVEKPSTGSSTAPAKAQPPMNPVNLLLNPSYEEGLVGWTAREMDPSGLVVEPSRVKRQGRMLRVIGREKGSSGPAQDVTRILRQQGPGTYAYGARIRSGTGSLPIKVTLVVEDEAGIHQHPSPDVEASPDVWVETSRIQAVHWSDLKQAWLLVETGWGTTGEFQVDHCWLSR